jgi:hypothetical protein
MRFHATLLSTGGTADTLKHLSLMKISDTLKHLSLMKI